MASLVRLVSGDDRRERVGLARMGQSSASLAGQS